MKTHVAWGIVGAVCLLALLWGFDRISKAATAELRADLATKDSIHSVERDTLLAVLKENRATMDSLRDESRLAAAGTQQARVATTGSFAELRAAVPLHLVGLVDATEANVEAERAAHERQLTLARAQTAAETRRADALQGAYDAAIAAWEAEERLREALEPAPSILGIELGDVPGLALAFAAGRFSK